VTESSPSFLDAIRATRNMLDALGVPWMLIGGVAVIAQGVPRLTADIDVTLRGAGTDPARVVDSARVQRITPRIERAIELARERHVLLLLHEPSGVPIDVSLAWLPFEEEALAAAEARDYAGVPVRVARAEDLVVYKLVAARPRDLDDAEKLLFLHGASLDVRRLRDLVGEFARALEDPERPKMLETLLRRAGLGGTP
jgi:predicted nucleotidyltransferase